MYKQGTAEFPPLGVPDSRPGRRARRWLGLHLRTREVWTISQANDASTYVFRLLGRQRARAQRLPADTLGAALEALAEEKRHALIELELTGGALGRLLIQAGRLVSAHLGDADAPGALATLRRNAGSARLQTLLLTDEQVALACAALAGAPVALGKEVGASFDSAAFVLQLGQQYFTGVVALEQGLQTHIRRFQYGTALSTERLPDRLRATRFTQIVWQEQLLPEVGTSQNTAQNAASPAAAPPQSQLVKPFGQAQPAVSPPVVQAAVPAPASHAAPDPVLDPAPDLEPDRLRAAPPPPAQVQGALQERSSEVPAYAEPVFVQAAPAVPAQILSSPALSSPALSSPALSSPALPAQSASAQAAPVGAVQAALAQAVQVQAVQVQTVQVQASPAPHYAEPTRVTAPAPAVAAADAEAWERLKAILEQNLGKRSPRVYQLMRTELGAFSGAELMSRLTWQVERIAGTVAARNFKNGR